MQIAKRRGRSFKCALTIKSDTRYLTTLREWLRSALRIGCDGQFVEKAFTACSIALVEAVDNAIFHAHANKKELPILIDLSVSPQKIVMDVVDTGEGIGHLDSAEPDILADHGRGLFLINSLMTSVTSRKESGRHRLRMILSI